MVKSKLLKIDPDEVVLHEIKRHPIGIFFIYAATAVIFFLFLGMLYFLIANADRFGFDSSTGGVTLMAVALGALIIGGGYLAVYIYKQNEMIVTNENIILINQVSLFSRKVSQLNLAKIQDVSGDQDTFLENTLGYGTLTIETAGEMKNFIFRHAPNPAVHAKHIIEAHEQFINANRGNTNLGGIDQSISNYE